MTRLIAAAVCVTLLTGTAWAAEAAPPAIGAQVPDFELLTINGQTLKLSDQLKEGKVVLLVMRGFPGYQCPICKRQANAFAMQADAFAKAGASVVMVYPGDIADLNTKALEFLGKQKLPQGFHMVIDPGYEFTNAWNLRWDAPKETAYPSTFVIGPDRKVMYAKISKTHGGRTNPDEVLKALE